MSDSIATRQTVSIQMVRNAPSHVHTQIQNQMWMKSAARVSEKSKYRSFVTIKTVLWKLYQVNRKKQKQTELCQKL